MGSEVALDKEVKDILDQAFALTVNSPDEYDFAYAYLQVIMSREDKIREFFEPQISTAKAALDMAKAGRDLLLGKTDKAVGVVKGQMLSYANSVEESPDPLLMTDTKLQGIRRNFSYEITDTNALPEKYWKRVVDEDLVKKDAKAGIAIPGVEVKDKKSIVVRR